MSEQVVGHGASRSLSDREIAYAIESLFKKVMFKFVTERECIERERSAFHDGAMWEQVWDAGMCGEKADYEATRRYPMPKEE